MEIKLFSKQELDTVFRVLRTALSSDALTTTELLFLKTYAKISEHPLPEKINPILVSEVHIDDPHKRKRLVQLSAMACLLSRPLKTQSVNFVTELDQILLTREPVIPVLKAVLENKKLKARLLTARRGARVILGEAYQAEGILGILRFISALLWQSRVNKNKLWNYKRLGLLPEGTLGRAYWKHITELGFGFPGEPGGIPETVAYHDVSHVLNEHDTSPLGEIQQGSFQGGSRRDGGFSFIQFVILQFHHGIKITPVAPGEVGNFDPQKVLWAIHRGAQFNYDVTHQWNFWDLMPLPLAEARKKCGLLEAHLI